MFLAFCLVVVMMRRIQGVSVATALSASNRARAKPKFFSFGAIPGNLAVHDCLGRGCGQLQSLADPEFCSAFYFILLSDKLRGSFTRPPQGIRTIGACMTDSMFCQTECGLEEQDLGPDLHRQSKDIVVLSFF